MRKIQCEQRHLNKAKLKTIRTLDLNHVTCETTNQPNPEDEIQVKNPNNKWRANQDDLYQFQYPVWGRY